MKRLRFFACFFVFALLVVSVFSGIYNGAEDEPVLDSGAEAVTEPELLTKSLADVSGVEVTAVVGDLSSDIAKLSAEVRNLQDKNLEPELQRQIEQLKLESEIARIKADLSKARKLGNSKQVSDYSAELEHLAKINDPVVGDENEQPEP